MPLIETPATFEPIYFNNTAPHRIAGQGDDDHVHALSSPQLAARRSRRLLPAAPAARRPLRPLPRHPPTRRWFRPPVEKDGRQQARLSSPPTSPASRRGPATTCWPTFPGFTIKSPSMNELDRGLGQATENVLINGERIANKSGGAVDELRRTAASNVDRIEIVDAASLGIAGLSGQVANVILKLAEEGQRPVRMAPRLPRSLFKARPVPRQRQLERQHGPARLHLLGQRRRRPRRRSADRSSSMIATTT